MYVTLWFEWQSPNDIIRGGFYVGLENGFV